MLKPSASPSLPPSPGRSVGVWEESSSSSSSSSSSIPPSLRHSRLCFSSQVDPWSMFSAPPHTWIAELPVRTQEVRLLFFFWVLFRSYFVSAAVLSPPLPIKRHHTVKLAVACKAVGSANRLEQFSPVMKSNAHLKRRVFNYFHLKKTKLKFPCRIAIKLFFFLSASLEVLHVYLESSDSLSRGGAIKAVKLDPIQPRIQLDVNEVGEVRNACTPCTVHGAGRAQEISIQQSILRFMKNSVLRVGVDA